GSAPTPDEKNWTAWVPLDRAHHPQGPAQRHRWAQLRFDLETGRPQASPHVLPHISLPFDFLPDLTPEKGRLTVTRPGSREVRIGATRFVSQEPSPRLKLLRERYKLDQVTAPGKTEMEQLMLLRYWVRNQWHTAWGNHPAAWMPPWDALIVLESKD